MKIIATILACLCLANGIFAQSKTSNSSFFIKNEGQIRDQKGKVNSDVLYLFPNSQGMNTQLRQNGFSYDLYSVGRNGQTVFNRIDINFTGSSNQMEIIESNKTASELNYYSAGSNAVIQTKVPQFRTITYQNVYSNIDVVFKSDSETGGVKYDIILHPGADLNDLQFQYNGADQIRLNKESLELSTNVRIIEESIPLSYYEEDGVERDVQFKLESNMIGFSLKKPLDQNKTLVIDPVPTFVWGKYIGDSLITNTNSVITDRFGFVYICGSTQSINNIATSGAYQDTINDSINDAYLTKYTNYGTVLWSTYFGGEDNDVANDVYVDTSFNVFLAGSTNSTMGILDSLGFQDTLGGGTDAFIAKFKDDGTLIWSSYFGGDSIDVGMKLSTDYYENVYLAGYTKSDSSIVIDSTFQETLSGDFDGFVAKFDTTGNLSWSSYIGGTALDMATGISFGDTSVFVSGITYSHDFPVTDSVYQDSLLGNSDGFLTRITSDGQLLWTTYFGGEKDDNIRNVKVFNNNIYFVGSTDSDSTISTPGSFQEFKSDSTDAFITEMDHDGIVQWSSYFGGDSLDLGVDLFFELDSNIIVYGLTESINLPFVDTSSYQEDLQGLSDGFITKISQYGDMMWSTYYGGPQAETAEAIAVYGNTAIYVVGNTYSDTILVPENQIYTSNEYNSDQEGYFTKFTQPKSTICNGIGGYTPGTVIYICPGDSILLTADGGELGTDAEWMWYQGQCGNSQVVGVGDSVYFSPTSATTYYVRAESITNATNCASITVDVLPTTQIQILSDSIACLGSDFTLEAAGAGIISWEGPNNFTHNDFDTTLISVTDSVAGWYSIEAVDSVGCQYTDSIEVIVVVPPSVTTEITHVTCFGYNDGQIAVSGQDLSGYEFEWIQLGPPTDTIVGQDSLINIYAGTYELTILDSNNCSYNESFVIMEPQSILIDTLIVPTACSDSSGSIMITTGNYMGEYSSFWDPTAQTGDTALNLHYGWHELTLVLDNKCIEEYSFFIDNINGLSVSIDSVTPTLCEGTPSGTATAQGLNGQAPFTYEWPDINQTGATAIDLDTGSYIVTVYDDAGCYAQDTVMIGSVHSIQVSEIVNASLCSDATGSVGLTIEPPSAYDISYSNGATQSTTIYNLSPGTYSATIIDTFGCQYDYDYFVGIINDLEVEIIPGDTIIEMGTDQQLEVTTNYVGIFNYAWTPITALSCGDCYNPIITPMQAESYEVVVWDSLGCTDTAWINIDISIPCLDVFIPSMFSPNNDQLNDEWNVIGTCIQSFHSSVYNQWGELLFESSDQSVGWDGYYQGVIVPNDQYTYVVDVIYTNGTAENFSGFVTVSN